MHAHMYACQLAEDTSVSWVLTPQGFPEAVTGASDSLPEQAKTGAPQQAMLGEGIVILRVHV